MFLVNIYMFIYKYINLFITYIIYVLQLYMIIKTKYLSSNFYSYKC